MILTPANAGCVTGTRRLSQQKNVQATTELGVYRIHERGVGLAMDVVISSLLPTERKTDRDSTAAQSLCSVYLQVNGRH